MRCIASLEPVAACRVRPPEPEPRSVAAQRARDRRTAASYLQAAAKTLDAFERTSLRRRAAELLLSTSGQSRPISAR